MRRTPALMALLCLVLAGCGKPSASSGAHDHTLRIITWADYVPAQLVADFKKETGIDVEITVSNNEEMISKLRATHGAGYDLAQPSQDRIISAQRDFGIYRPFDLSRLKLDEFDSELLAIVRQNATEEGKLYALPYLWGTEALVVNTKQAQVEDYTDLCRPDLKGRTAVRLRRPTLMAFAFALGKDPFALYANQAAYASLMDEVGNKLIACKPNFKFFIDNKDQLLNAMRSGEVIAAMMWDTGGWTLHRDNPDIRYVVPRSGALAWLDTFALPAKGRNEAGAYAWINFVMRPENAARVAKSVGSFSAATGVEALLDQRMKDDFAAAFPDRSLKNVHWYPVIPPGLEAIEGKVLDRVKAAN